VRKKKVKVCTPEYCKFKLTQYIFYICTQYNDYYQIINEVAQLRQHKQRLNDLRTQLGCWNSHIDILYYY